MKLETAARTVTAFSEYMADTIVDRDSDATDYKLQPSSKSVANLPSDMGSEMDRTIADLSVMKKTDVEARVGNFLTKWTNILQSHVIQAYSHIRGCMKLSYSTLNNDLQPVVFNFVEPALSEVIRYGRAPTLSNVEMCSLVQTESVVDTIVKSVVYNTGIIFPVAETVEQMVDKAVYEYCFAGHGRGIDNSLWRRVASSALATSRKEAI